MEKRKRKIGKMLIALIVILVGIIMFSYLENPLRTNIISKKEAMSTEEILNVGRNGIISETVITNRLTGTGPFDNDDTAGNDSAEENDIVRSFDQITWTIENTMQLKDGTINSGLKGGRIQIKAELPENTANIVKWDLDSMKWAEDATVSSDGRILTASYTMVDSKVTIPGKQNLVVVLKVLGAVNGTEIKPTFTVSLAGNSNGEEKTITDSAVKVSARPSYNIELKQNTELYKQVDISQNGNTTTGRLYGYFLGLQLYNGDNPDKGMKGIEFPKGNITFDIDLKMERTNNGENNPTDITSGATPILYNYALNESTNTSGTIAGRPMNGHTAYSQYHFNYPANNGNGVSESVYNSGSINMVQQGSKLKVTINNYELNKEGIFPKTRYKDINITNNIGYFGAYYFQVLVPFTEATEQDGSYYLTVSDANLSATSLGNTTVSNQALLNDDAERFEFVRYPKGQFTDANWLKTGWNTGNSIGNGGLYTAYDQGDARAAVGQVFVAKTGVASNPQNSEYATVLSANSLLKFDGEAFEISEIDGKTWNLENSSEISVPYHNTGKMNFQMLYAAKRDGTNWSSDDEMKNAVEADLVFFTSLENLKASLGQNAVCIGVLWESISGSMGPGSDYALGLALKVTNNAQKGNVYQFISRHTLYYNELDRETQTRSNPNATYPNANVNIKFGERYVKTGYDENGDVKEGTHSGNYVYGQSLLIIEGEVSVEKTVADIADGKTKVNYDLGRNETVVTYNVKPMLKSLKGSTEKISDITITLTDTLPKGLKYINGSSNSIYGEPTVTENADGTSTLVWRKGTFALDEDIPELTYKAAIDLTSENGASYTSSVIIEADKLVKTPTQTRTSKVAISITKLAAYSLYKDTETPIIEKNGEGSYNVVMLNMTGESVPAFQLLDILPYNGDKIGTSYNGTYTITKIELSGNVTGKQVSVDNLRIAITESENVRNDVTAKDTNLGNGGIWQTVSNGADINKQLTAFAIVGELPAGVQLTAKVYIKTNGNEGADEYNNSATAQTNPATAVIESPVATIQVRNRMLDGRVWLDSNEDGLISEGEQFLEGVKVTLLNEDGTVAKDTTGNPISSVKTDKNGYYKFENLAKGNYIVEVEYVTESGTIEITKKNVGNNDAINSKFNANRKTDVLTKLNVDNVLIAKEENINAGIIYRVPAKLIVHHYFYNEETQEYTTIKLAEDELTNGHIGDDYTTTKSPLVPQNYVCVNETPDKYEGKMLTPETEVIYYYKLTNETVENTITKDAKADKTVDGKEVLTEENGIVTYTIKYSVSIKDYIGKAKITLVDTLPAKIDVLRSNLAGGAYNKVANTITWEQTVEGINTYESENQTYTNTIEKVIKIVYVDQDLDAELVNKVKGTTVTYYPDNNPVKPGEEKTTVEAETEEPIIQECPEGKIIVEYKDIDTDKDIPYIDENGEEKLYNYEDEGKVGEDYKTEAEDIPYYELVKEPENKEGKYKEEDQTITYYYRKLPFNIGVEKTVKEIIVNGESKNVGDGKLSKIEIPESKLSKTEMIVKYKIVVKNTGKVDGTAELVDTIPAQFEIANENPTYWTQLQGGRIQTNVDLKVGEEKELEVVLSWKKGSQNLGTTKNVAEITYTDNTPKYPDNNPDDNISIAEVIISVKTGREVISEILLISGTIGLVMLLATTLVDVKISNRKK